MGFLYDQQKRAVDKMRNGCILNGDTGSGKSRTGLYYYFKQCGGAIDEDYHEMSHPLDLYIITTAMKRDKLEWDKEMLPYMIKSKTLYPNLTVVVDSWNNIVKYKDVKGAFFIFDEDRVIGSGAWSKAFIQIAKANQWIILSATPGDKWEDYISVFVANGFYRNKTEFVRLHCIYSRYSNFPKIERYVDTERLVRLRDRILVDMEIERHTTQYHEPIWVDYDKAAYRKARIDRWDYIEDLPIETPSGLCNCLRRIVNSDPSRINAVIELVEEHKKCIIFYNYNYELDILKEVFEKSVYEVAEWNGHKHQEIPQSDKFVYLVQYTAGCEGWNCITTDTIIFYSENYSYRTMKQAAGRIDRLNTPFIDLHYYHLKSHSDIDLSIAKALNKKKDFNKRKFFDSYI